VVTSLVRSCLSKHSVPYHHLSKCCSTSATTLILCTPTSTSFYNVLRKSSLLEVSSRISYVSNKYLYELTKCITYDAMARYEAKASWKSAKSAKSKIVCLTNGAFDEIFKARPILKDMTAYYMGDVQSHVQSLRPEAFLHPNLPTLQQHNLL